MNLMKRTFFLILGIIFSCLSSFGQTYTGTFRTVAGNTTYHQFNRNGVGAAVYINQEATNQPILRLSSGTATANENVVLSVESDGSVGIGTNTPKAKLAVEGNILAKEIKIKTDIAVPDYVFDPNYQLPSLSSIENYVKKHRHLPEIPSAIDIQKDGVDLTVMNLALLKKVEELTLHLIAKEKEIDELKQTQKSSLQEFSERLNKLEKCRVKN